MLCYAPHHAVIEECTLNVYRHVHPDRGPWVRGGKATRGVLRAGKKRAAGSLNARQALRAVRTSRPQANPYVVSWEIARARLLAHRLEDIYLYSQVDAGGNTIDDGGDWIKRDLERAEKGVIAEVFKRAIDTDLSMYGALIEGDYQQQRH